MPEPAETTPTGTPAALKTYFVPDLKAGFLVFLIALPLCLGIAIASGFPPIAGVFTAIIGGILGSIISNSEMTIKGPAAGLIVIVIGCIHDFGGDGILNGFSPQDTAAYKAALAVSLVAAALQIGFGFLKGGILADLFPVPAVRGMLAAIGAIIILKQIPVALGVPASGEPIELIKELPHIIAHTNPAVAAIAVASLLIMLAWPRAAARIRPLAKIPAPLVVIAVAIPAALALGFNAEGTYTLAGHTFEKGPEFLVAMPDRVFGMFDNLTTPDLSVLTQPKAWKWIAMFFLIGTLESALSAKAVDLLDPYRRRTNLDRDILAVGTANAACAAVGGLPMISEIVRSRANIDSGAMTRWANLWHGLCMLVCVAMIPMVIQLIPLAALAALLIFTGFRLANPAQLRQILSVGREQLAVFLTTVIAVLATDLLIGIAIGIALKFAIHFAQGLSPRHIFKPALHTDAQPGQRVIQVRSAAVFSNWAALSTHLTHKGLRDRSNITLDFAQSPLVDHTVLSRLSELQARFEQEGLTLGLTGLEALQPVSAHPLATRRAISRT